MRDMGIGEPFSFSQKYPRSHKGQKYGQYQNSNQYQLHAVKIMIYSATSHTPSPHLKLVGVYGHGCWHGLW